MNLKVGDKVTIKKGLKPGKMYGNINFVEEMNFLSGKEFIISKAYQDDNVYYLEGGASWSWSEEMFEKKHEQCLYSVEREWPIDTTLLSATSTISTYKIKEEDLQMDANKTLSLYKALKCKEIEKEFDEKVESIRKEIEENISIEEMEKGMIESLSITLINMGDEYVTYDTTTDEEGNIIPNIKLSILGVNVKSEHETKEYEEAEIVREEQKQELLNKLARVEAYIADTCETKKDVKAALIEFEIMDKKGKLNI